MTPEEAMDIDFKAREVEYQKHRKEYKPVNQMQVILAGYQAVIDAVKSEATKELAEKYLSYKFGD